MELLLSLNICMHHPICVSVSASFLFDHTPPDLQRMATGIILTVVNRKLVTDNWRIHSGVDGAQAVRGVVVPIQSQVGGVEA